MKSKTIAKWLLGAYLLALTAPVWAVVIEGVTPTGKFKTVGVTEQGRLAVAVDTTTLPTAGTLLSNCAVLTGGAEQQLMAPLATRVGALVCNQDATLNAWVYRTTGTLTNAPTLFPGACVNFDEGSGITYIGAIIAYSSASLQVCWYDKRP